MGADSRPTTPKSILRRAVPSHPTDGSQRKRVTFEEGIWNKSGLCRVPKPTRHSTAGVGIPRRSRIDARDMNLASSVQTLILGGCGLPSSTSSGALRAGANSKAVGGTSGRGGRAARMAAAAMAVGLNPVSKTAPAVHPISRGREGGVVSSPATSKSGTAKCSSRNPKAAGLIVDRRGRHTALAGKSTAVPNETVAGVFSREARRGRSSAVGAADDSSYSALREPPSGDEPKGVCVLRTKSCGSTRIDSATESQAIERDQAQAAADDRPRLPDKDPKACLSFPPEGSRRGEGSGAADDSLTSGHEARRDKELGTVTAETETTTCSAAACVSGVLQDRLGPSPPRLRLSPVAPRAGRSGDVADEESGEAPEEVNCKSGKSLDVCKSFDGAVPVTAERREGGSTVEPCKPFTARCKMLDSSTLGAEAVHPDREGTVAPACGVPSAEHLGPNHPVELARLQSLDDTACEAEVVSYSPTSVSKPKDDSTATGRTPSRAKQELVIVTPPWSESSMESPFSPPSGDFESLPCKFDGEGSSCRAAGGDADSSKHGGPRYAANAPGYDTRRARCRRAGMEIPKVPSIAWEESNIGPGDTIPADSMSPSPAVMSAAPGLGKDVVDPRAADTVDAPSIVGKDRADGKLVGDPIDTKDPPIPRSCCSSADADGGDGDGDGAGGVADGPSGVSHGGHDSEGNRVDNLGDAGFSSSAAEAAGENSSPPPRDGVQEDVTADDQLRMDHSRDGPDGARDQASAPTMENSMRDEDFTKSAALRDRSSCHPGVDRSERKTARKRARNAPRAKDSGDSVVCADANSSNSSSSEGRDAPGEVLCAPVPVPEGMKGLDRDAVEPASGRGARDDEDDPTEAEVEAGDAMGAPEVGAEENCGGVACAPKATGVAEEDDTDWEDIPLGEALKRLGKRRSPGSDATRDNDAEKASIPCDDGDTPCPPQGCNNPVSHSARNGVTCTETATDFEEVQDSSLARLVCEDEDERRRGHELDDKVEEEVILFPSEAAHSACDNGSNAAGSTGRGTGTGTVADDEEGKIEGDEVAGGEEARGGCADVTSGTGGDEGCVPAGEVDWEDLPLGEAMRQLRMKNGLRPGDDDTPVDAARTLPASDASCLSGDNRAPASSGDDKDARAHFEDETEKTTSVPPSATAGSPNRADDARASQVLGLDVSCPVEHAEDQVEKLPEACSSGDDMNARANFEGETEKTTSVPPNATAGSPNRADDARASQVLGLDVSCPVEHAEDHAENVPEASSSSVDEGEASSSDGLWDRELPVGPVKLEPCVESGRPSLRARERSLSPSRPRKSQRVSQASDSDGWHSDSSGGGSSNAESSVSIVLVVPGSPSGDHPPVATSFVSSRTRNKRQRQEMEKEENVKETESPDGEDDSAPRKRRTRGGMNLLPAVSLPEASRRQSSSSRKESVLEDDEKAASSPAVPPTGASIAGSTKFSRRSSSGEVGESWKRVAPDVKDGDVLGDRKAVVPLRVRGWMEPAYRFAVGLRLGQRRASTGSVVDGASAERVLSSGGGAATGASVYEVGAGEFVTRQKSSLGSGVWGWMKPMTRLVSRVDE